VSKKCIGVIPAGKPAFSARMKHITRSGAQSLLQRFEAEAVEFDDRGRVCAIRLVEELSQSSAAEIGLQQRSVSTYHDGPIGVGNLLPFARTNNNGDKLHYEIPMAGDRTVYRRHSRRRISVSHRIPDEVFLAQVVAAYNARLRSRQVSA
jgi:hypothetical protein